MTGTLAAKKTTGLGDLFADYTPQELEERKTIASTENQMMKDLLQKYAQIHHYCLERDGFSAEFVRKRFIDPIVTEVLPSVEINAFLQSTIEYAHHFSYYINMGYFINKLMQNAVKSGITSFMLNTQHVGPLQTIANGIQGSKEKPVSIDIVGDLLRDSGHLTSYVKLHVNVAGSDFGYKSRHGHFIAREFRYEFGRRAQDCYFDIGRMMVSKTPAPEATHCTFKVYKEAYAKILQKYLLPPNRIILAKDGEEKMVRDFD